MEGPVCVVACILLSGYVVGLNVGENCLTPDGESGRCIRIGECHEYSSLLVVIPPPAAVLNLLMKAKCGVFEKKPLLCCPGGGTPSKQSEVQMRAACVTPNNSRGTCIEVRNCPPLVELLKAKPLLPSSLENLRKSQCGFHDKQPLACCPAQNAAPNPAPKPPSGEFVEDVSRHPNLHLLRNDICGIDPYERIIRNGDTARLYKTPWNTLIAYSGIKGNSSPFRCGSTIINDLYILTTGHCVKYLSPGLRPISVRVGEQYLDSRIDCEKKFGTKTCASEPQDIPVAQILVHPQYTGKLDLHNDIALIRLTRKIDFSPDSARPVCLPIGLAQQDINLAGKKLTVSGWGFNENHTYARVIRVVKSHAECAKDYENQLQISAVTQLCAEGDSCRIGDLTYNGSVEGTERTILFGVPSFGSGNCKSMSYLEVYTRVGFYMKWILDNLRP